MVGITDIIPLLVFIGFVMAVWGVLSLISDRNSRAQDRLTRLSRPMSAGEISIENKKEERMQGLVETAKALAKPMMPQSESDASTLRTELGYAGFRSD